MAQHHSKFWVISGPRSRRTTRKLHPAPKPSKTLLADSVRQILAADETKHKSTPQKRLAVSNSKKKDKGSGTVSNRTPRFTGGPDARELKNLIIIILTTNKKGNS